MRVSISNLQYSLLYEIYEKRGFSLPQMLAVKQTTAGSLVRHGWVAWNKNSTRFVITDEGKLVIKLYAFTDVSRKNKKGKLSNEIKNRWAVEKDSYFSSRRRSAAA